MREHMESSESSQSESEAYGEDEFYFAPGSVPQRGRKRKADEVVDLTDTSGLEAVTTQEPAKPPKQQKTSTSTAPLRRPTRLDAWYSHRTSTEENWNKLTPQMKRNLSNVGYIQETEAGMFAPEPCRRCRYMSLTNINKAGGPASERLVCMVYKPEVAKQCTKAQGQNWRSCSSCWSKGASCCFVRDAQD